MVLYRVLHKPIGQSWCLVSGLLFLGIRQIRVEFRDSGTFFELKISLMKEVTKGPTTFQKRWKKIGWKPSSPDAL